MSKERKYSQGLMVKLHHRMVIGFLEKKRDEGKTNVQVVEEALSYYLKVRLPDRKYGKRPRKKGIDYNGGLPVKISDRLLIKEILRRKISEGVPHSFTVEKAILNYMGA